VSEAADIRRIHLLEALAEGEESQDLDALTALLNCDVKTLRRDLDYLQQLLHRVQGLQVRRGKTLVARAGYSPGYFTDQLERNTAAKEAIARAVVSILPSDQAVVLTAGSTPYAVARELRRAAIAGEPPHDLIVFTNSLPALQELVAASISTGVLGEIYVPEDCALHAPDYASAFQPSIAIVGASGVQFAGGSLELFSHRAEEAAFMKQVLAPVSEVIVAVDQTKLGKRHPWNFVGSTLHNKRVQLVTDGLTETQRQELTNLIARLARSGIVFSFLVAGEPSVGGGESTR
jgi:DeoR/GlpR family transcriptional regulator of sugar metabolism